MKKACLVLEGGAMRGIYTSAIIDTFLDENIMFDSLIGVSAGALFGVNYVSKQKGRSLRYNKKYCKEDIIVIGYYIPYDNKKAEETITYMNKKMDEMNQIMVEFAKIQYNHSID